MPNYFGVLDYVLFIAMFLVSIGFGVYFGIKGRRNQNTQEYLMGGRNLSLVPVALSITVSLLSTNMMLGGPAEIYTYGIMFAIMFVGAFFAGLVTAFVFVPLFYPLQLVSVNQYLELRFKSKSVRYLGSTLFLLNSMFYSGTVIFGPATALNIVTGTPPWASIVIVSVVGTIYTSIGGMKAVIWADAFQAFVMLGGMMAICIMGSNAVGGIGEVWNINKAWGRLNIDTSTDFTTRYSLASVMIGLFHYWTAKFGVNQPCVQRYCAMDTPLRGKLSVLLNIPPFFVFHMLSVLTGMVTFAFYTHKGCDPVKAGHIDNQNQVVPYLVMEVMPYPGLTGVFMSSVFSASLSTLSSSINSMTAVIWEDVLKERLGHLPPSNQALITKLMALVFGLVCTGISFLVLFVGGNILQISSSFNGATLGPMLGLFLLGPLIPWANWKGALSGGLTALTFALWLMFGQVFSKLQRVSLPSDTSSCSDGTWNMTTTSSSFYPSTTVMAEPEVTEVSGLQQFYSISFSWFTMISMVIVLGVGTVVSFMTGPEDYSKIDPILLFPCIRKEKIVKTDYKAIKIDEVSHGKERVALGDLDVTRT